MSVSKLISYVTALVALLCFACCGVGAQALDAADIAPDEFVYGYSELGRELRCARVGAEDARHTLLLVFCVHGFEDAYARDGAALVDIAGRILAHYRESAESLVDMALYVVPCANPDGLYEGDSKNGFGRCNALGLDINRDFPVGWVKRSSSRNQTGDVPFSTAEARALRDLVEVVAPDSAVDVHGWLNCAYGSEALCAPFMQAFGIERREYEHGGYLSQWLAQEAADAALLELPKPKGDTDAYAAGTATDMIAAIDAWAKRDD